MISSVSSFSGLVGDQISSTSPIKTVTTSKIESKIKTINSNSSNNIADLSPLPTPKAIDDCSNNSRSSKRQQQQQQENVSLIDFIKIVN